MTVGTFTGGYTLRRVGRGEYQYIPDPGDPLTFTRPDGMPVAVSKMFGTTDLGSVPRIFWWIPGLAPNDMERASIVHDALYLDHKAGLDVFGFRESNRVLGEALVAEGYAPWKAWVLRKVCDWFGRRVWDMPAAQAYLEGRPWK